MNDIDTDLIWSQISNINDDITKYTDAKTAIETVRDNCSTIIDSWSMSYDTLNNDTDLVSVKKADVFEGEMANGLSDEVPDVLSDISNHITKAKSLKSALNTQISNIDTKIQQLNNDKTSLMNQL